MILLAEKALSQEPISIAIYTLAFVVIVYRILREGKI